MKIHNFHRRYANVPIDKRFKSFVTREGIVSLYDKYNQIKRIEDELRPKQIELAMLIREANGMIDIVTKKKN